MGPPRIRSLVAFVAAATTVIPAVAWADDAPLDVKLPPTAPPPSPAPPSGTSPTTSSEPGPPPTAPPPPEAEAAPSWHLAAGAGTDFPMAVGVRGHVEAPARVRISTSIGVLPRPYVSAITAFLVGIDAFSEPTGELVESALSASLIWRTHLGYRPFPKLGLYAELGYGFVGLGGSASTAELVSGILGQALPQRANALGGRFEFDVKSALHMFDIEIGYDIPVSERFQVRAALGAALTLASKTTLDAKFAGNDPAFLRRLEALAAAYLDDVYTSYVFTPVLSVSGSYVFF